MITIVNPERRIIDVASMFIGVREEGGSNRGDVPDFANWLTIRDMRDYPIGGRGAMWCATFVNLVGRLAVGVLWPIPCQPEFSDVDKIVDWGKSNQVFNIGDPTRGDLFVIRKGTGHSHIGFVIQYGSVEIPTIEGNTNDDGSANGDGVYERQRSVHGLDFIRPLAVVGR